MHDGFKLLRSYCNFALHYVCRVILAIVFFIVNEGKEKSTSKRVLHFMDHNIYYDRVIVTVSVQCEILDAIKLIGKYCIVEERKYETRKKI